MERWQKSLRNSVRDLHTLAEKFGLSEEKLREVVHTFPFLISPHYASLIRQKGDPIYRQCVPDEAELVGNEPLLEDPLAEEAHSPAPNIICRYPDRCLFLVSNACATYCRFCTRKRKFSTRNRIDPTHLEPGFRYIETHPEIRDVLISGGDPFLLEDERIEEILRRLRSISHVEILRIGTRTPCVLPERITLKLARMLKKYPPLYIHVHFNHPDEVTPEAVRALARLADAGIPLGSQTVLLKGVNDDPQIMLRLMHKLLAARVRPYYLFQCDLVHGTGHFRTPLAKGLEIMKAMHGWTSGMAVPHYAIDLPCGGGKIPLVPDYLESRTKNILHFRTYRGTPCAYPDLPNPPPPSETPTSSKETS